VKLLGDIVTPLKNNNMKTSTCCGAPLWGTEDPICSECKEHCDYEIIEDEPSN
jgi:hypothetical protein